MNQVTYQKPTQSQRLEIIKKTFIKKMCALQSPHKHLVDNKSTDAYLKEISTLLDDKLPQAENQDHFVDMLRDVWRNAISKHTGRFFFPLDIVSKSISMVATDHYRKFIAPYQPKATYQDPKFNEDRGSKEFPETQGWTQEKAREAIAETQQMIDSGELPKSLGNMLIRIPQKALERLQRLEEVNG